MVGRDAAPTDVGRSPALIKAALEEMGTMDVLVCGTCWAVFHFVEEFKQHKEKPCKRDPSATERENKDSRPKIWAFLLWKAKTLRQSKLANTPAPTSWALYQSWVKLEENVRETWMVAGKTIQSFSAAGKGELSEMPVKITKTIVNSSDLAQRNLILAQAKGTRMKIVEASNAINQSPGTAGAVKLAGVTPKPVIRRAKRTPNASENSKTLTEENVEKIVAKRFNPRHKMYEYLVKWESRQHEQNTWELASHLEKTPHLLDIFERQLARQKETRARLSTFPNALARKPNDNQKDKTTTDANKNALGVKSNTVNENDKSPNTSTNERPARTSKTRAMDQVKQWMSGSPTRILCT